MQKRFKTEVVAAFCDGVVEQGSLFSRLARRYNEEKRTVLAADYEVELGAVIPDNIEIDPDALVFP